MPFDMDKPGLVKIRNVRRARSDAVLMKAPDKVRADAHINPVAIWFAMILVQPPFSIRALFANGDVKESQAPHQVRGDGDGRTEFRSINGWRPANHAHSALAANADFAR